jgi:arginine exporter protein ArgO
MIEQLLFNVSYFWKVLQNKMKMKKLFIPIMIIAVGIALYEQSKNSPNVYIMIGAIVIFMYGMMRLTAKVPSKNQDNSQENDSERR